MAKAYKPTAEQEAVVEAAKGGGDLKVKAYAGAGKTSTLRLVAQQLTGQRGSYLAFNKEIADSARRGFPAHVSARTVHSLAYAGAPAWLTARINLPSEPPHELAARYGFGPIEVPTITGKNAEVAPFEIGRMIADGLGRFCRSADDRPQPFHIPVDEKIRDDAADWLREQLAPSIARLWGESVNPRGLKAIQPDNISRYGLNRIRGSTPTSSCSTRRRIATASCCLSLHSSGTRRRSTSAIPISRSTSGAVPSTRWRRSMRPSGR